MFEWIREVLNIFGTQSEEEQSTDAETAMRDVIFPDFDPNDWRCLVRVHHFWECTELAFDDDGEVQSFGNSPAPHRLQELANKQLTKYDQSGFLFECALARDTQEIEALIQTTYDELQLPDPQTNGLLHYLIPLLRKEDLALAVQAKFVREMLEPRTWKHRFDQRPPISSPYEELYVSAQNCELAWDYPKNQERELRAQYKEFRKLFLENPPDVTPPDEIARPSH